MCECTRQAFLETPTARIPGVAFHLRVTRRRPKLGCGRVQQFRASATWHFPEYLGSASQYSNKLGFPPITQGPYGQPAAPCLDYGDNAPFAQSCSPAPSPNSAVCGHLLQKT